MKTVGLYNTCHEMLFKKLIDIPDTPSIRDLRVSRTR